MYEYINGQVADIGLDYAVLEANGVGYLLYCSAKTLEKLVIHEQSKLYVHLYVAEDQMSMYGFYTKDEREMFRQLIGVTRIGKKIALNLLSLLSPNEIVFAVQTDNEKAFDKVSGMGKKSTQRLILELKEKVEFLPQADGEANEKTENDAKIHDAIEALISLGYDGAVAGRAVGAVKDFSGTEDLIKKALLIIAKK